MTVREYVRVLRKRWRVIVALALVGLLAAVGITLAMPVTYSAQATAFVAISNPGSEGTASLVQNSQFALQRVKSYPEVVGSPDVLQPVIDKLNLDETVQQLGKTVTADNPVDTVLITVAATDSSASRASQVANAVSDQLGTVIEQLEASRSGGVSPVKVTTAVPAEVPTSPVSPRRTINLALGLLVGLALGIIGAVLREQQDTTIKDGDLEQISGRAPLALIGYNGSANDKPLVVLDASSPSVEEFRTMRTNLQFVDVDNPPRSLVITSAVASEGKSTTSVNLAVTLARSSLRVCLVEADLRRPKVADFLGIDGAVGLSNVLAGQFSIDEVLVPWQDGLLTVLPAGTTPPDPSKLLGSQTMVQLLADLRERFDFVIVDAPPILPVKDAAILAHVTDGAVFVTRYGHARRDQVARGLEELTTVKARLVGTVLTCVPLRSQRRLRGHTYQYTEVDAAPVEVSRPVEPPAQEEREGGDQTVAAASSTAVAAPAPSKGARQRPGTAPGSMKPGRRHTDS